MPKTAFGRTIGVIALGCSLLHLSATVLYGGRLGPAADQNSLLAFAALLSLIILIGLFSMSSRGQARDGLSTAGLWLGMIGAGLAFLGHGGEAIAFRPFNILSGTPVLAFTPLLYGVGSLALALGLAVLGAGILRSRILPTWTGVALILFPLLQFLFSLWVTQPTPLFTSLIGLSYAMPWLALGVSLLFSISPAD